MGAVMEDEGFGFSVPAVPGMAFYKMVGFDRPILQYFQALRYHLNSEMVQGRVVDNVGGDH